MFLLTFLGILVLIVIAGFHVAWANRLWWPVGNEAVLARSVAGFPGIDRMPPPTACLFVAVALVFMAGLLVAAQIVATPAWWVKTGLLVSSAIFLARGLGGFTALWARLTPEEPFHSLDLRYFSPLALAIGVIAALTAATLD